MTHPLIRLIGVTSFVFLTGCAVTPPPVAPPELPAVVVTPDRMRSVVSRALRGRLGDVAVLGQGEIPQDCEVNMDAVEA